MSSRLHRPRSKRAATAPSSFRPDRPGARGHDGRHEGRMHGQDKRRPSRRPRRLAPGFYKEGRHGTRARARTEASRAIAASFTQGRTAYTRAPLTAWPGPCTTTATESTSRSRPPPRAAASTRWAWRHTTWRTARTVTTWRAATPASLRGRRGRWLVGSLPFASKGPRGVRASRPRKGDMQSRAHPARALQMLGLLVRAPVPGARTPSRARPAPGATSGSSRS